jgi:hypothetical protein
MKSHANTGYLLLFIVWVLAVRPGDLHAGTISGDLQSGWRSAAAAGKGTTALFVYSKQTAPPPASENATSRHFLLLFPPAFAPDIANPIPQAPAPAGFQVNIRVDGRRVGPVLSAGDQPKRVGMIQGQNVRGDRAESHSGFFTGGAAAVTNPAAIGNNPFVSAQGSKPKAADAAGAVGEAAGAAFDPFEVDPGTYLDYQYTVNASLQLDQMGDFGGVTFFALDSRLMPSSAALDAFYQRGQPFDEALWVLSLSANGVPGSPSDIAVHFRINPQAIADNILFLDTDHDQVNDLDDAAIEDLIKQDIEIVGDSAVLTGLELFPEGTEYNVSGVVTYGDGVNALLMSSAVPAPSTMVLLGLGALCLMGFIRRSMLAVSSGSPWVGVRPFHL